MKVNYGALHRIIRTQTEGELNQFLKNNFSQGMLTDTNQHGETPLMVAAAMNYIGAMKTLLRYGAHVSVNFKNKKGRTALFLAAGLGALNAVDILLQYGANINLCDKYHYSPLQAAILRRQSRPLIEFLIDNGASIDYARPNQQTALKIAYKNYFTSHTNIDDEIINTLQARSTHLSFLDYMYKLKCALVKINTKFYVKDRISNPVKTLEQNKLLMLKKDLFINPLSLTSTLLARVINIKNTHLSNVEIGNIKRDHIKYLFMYEAVNVNDFQPINNMKSSSKDRSLSLNI